MTTWSPATAPLLIILAACGMKTDPVAPELVHPLPATALEATTTPEGVRLRWRRPTHYSGGERMRDLERFDIERASAGSDAFEHVGALVLEDHYRFRQPRRLEWTDTDAVPGVRYRYRVIAVTFDGSRSPPSDSVAVGQDPRTANDDGES